MTMFALEMIDQRKEGQWTAEMRFQKFTQYWKEAAEESLGKLVCGHHFLHFRMLLLFSLTSYLGKIAYFNSPNRELSNGALVMELYWNRNVDPSRNPCLKAIDRKSIERGNFLVLRPALLKIAHFNSANRQLSIAVLPKELRKRKIVNPSRGTP